MRFMEKMSPKELPKLILRIIICADTNIATADGVFQISDTVTPLKPNQQYDKMSIRNVDATGLAINMETRTTRSPSARTKTLFRSRTSTSRLLTRTAQLTTRSDIISTS
jgi:hypothetical protein